MTKEQLEDLVKNELAGKNGAIHAYDKMMWTVRTGFITLVFAGWGLLIKAAVEYGRTIMQVESYIDMLAAATIIIAVSGYMVDSNYAKRKFRVISAIDQLTKLWILTDPGKINDDDQAEFIRLLSISGDVANNKYKSSAFSNEQFVSIVIYFFPAASTAIFAILLILISV